MYYEHNTWFWQNMWTILTCHRLNNKHRTSHRPCKCRPTLIKCHYVLQSVSFEFCSPLSEEVRITPVQLSLSYFSVVSWWEDNMIQIHPTLKCVLCQFYLLYNGKIDLGACTCTLQQDIILFNKYFTQWTCITSFPSTLQHHRKTG